jgi:multidrug efflux pump subunit AcrB
MPKRNQCAIQPQYLIDYQSPCCNFTNAYIEKWIRTLFKTAIIIVFIITVIIINITYTIIVIVTYND